jgi:hypothetical protein
VNITTVVKVPNGCTPLVSIHQDQSNLFPFVAAKMQLSVAPRVWQILDRKGAMKLPQGGREIATLKMTRLDIECSR